MTMWRYTLLGKYSNRTPLAYDVYKHAIHKKTLINAKEVSINNGPDVLILGHIKDLDNEIDSIRFAIKINPSVKIIIISEEPFWDSVWEENFFIRKKTYTHEKCEFNYFSLNHCTSEIFTFSKIPYFITTDDNFITHYRLAFARNIALSKDVLTKQWNNSSYEAAFFAIKRMNDKFNVKYPEQDIYGLCTYRSIITQMYKKPTVLRVGKGWKSGPMRQEVPDWHLEKIAFIDKKVKFLSAIENTHQINYISEKLFDAYATAAIPLYFASEQHRVFDLVPQGSFINLFDTDPEGAIEKINSFVISDDFIEQYLDAQKRLNRLFQDTATLAEERDRVCHQINTEIYSILKDI